ncbi:MAG: SUMF1/EgtB/PvdO family nonheme iron enzyme [Kofleriaceae bacterium]
MRDARKRIQLAIVFLLGSCGFPALPMVAGGGGDDAHVEGDAKLDAPSNMLTITASPSRFIVHTGDLRETHITITNGTAQSGTPTLGVSGLTNSGMTFTANTCTTELAPGGTCTAIGNLSGGIPAAEEDFQVTASSAALGTAMAAMSVIVRPFCALTCGANGTANCCASSVVAGNAVGASLAGTAYYRIYDVGTDGMYTNMNYPATVSDFRLDKYLVTVGRFREFVNAGMGTQSSPPAAGDGARPLNGIANQGGWDSSFNTSLASSTIALTTALKCSAARQTWTDIAGSNESLPINCLTWYEAAAFCAWDGGFLATLAEGQYATSGGSEQRAYAFSNPPSSLTFDCTYANYSANFTTFCTGSGVANRVGSESPKGDGKWGQSDLVGNLYDWALDWGNMLTGSCDNCAALIPEGGVNFRSMRGGPFDGPPKRGGATFVIATPATRSYEIGARCARFQ